MTTITELQSQISTQTNAQVATMATADTLTKMNIASLKNTLVAESIDTHLETVRPSENPTALSVFSDQIEKATIHFLEVPEKRGYVQCNGQGCVLCDAGNKQTVRILMPAYNVITRQVEVLPMSEANNPHALLPQILPAFDAVEPTLMMVSRHFNKYTVELRPTPDNIDIGQSKIEAFNTAFDKGDIKLNSIYPTCSNEELAALPSIQTMLLLNNKPTVA